jgi:drug/metabolite transporter (DMT)-like permease
MIGRGEICALLAPLAWSVAVVFFKRASVVAPVSLNLFKNSVAVGLLVVTMAVAGIAVPPDRSPEDWARLLGSGLIGLALGDTLIFGALARIGAARLAVVDTVYAPLVVLLAWAFLGETPGASFLLGAAAVLGGIAIASVPRAPVEGGGREGAASAPAPGATPQDVVTGTVMAVGAIACTAVGVVLAKPALGSGHLVEITCTRLVAGVVGQLVWVGLRGEGARAAEAFRPGGPWRVLLPGAVIGTYLALVLWLGGFAWADASVAAVLNQLATVYILVFARVFLGESLQPRQIVGALVAAAGAAWIVVGR